MCSGMSQAAACVLAWWCPACRWRELGLGSGVERGNLRRDMVASEMRMLLTGRESETSKRLNP